jgi:hypothetical protein
MKNLSATATVFIALVIASGTAVLGLALFSWKSANWTEFLALLVVALVASRLRVKLPGVTGTLSVNLPFILLAVAEMDSAEALIIGCLSTLVQCLPRAQQKFNWMQAWFNFANMALAVSATRLLYQATALQSVIHSPALLLAVAAAGFYVVNSIPVAIIMGLTEKRSALRAWLAMVQLSYPYYLASAGVAGVVLTASAQLGWQVPLAMLPLMAGIFYSHQRYFSVTGQQQEEVRRAPQSAKVAHVAF